MFLQSLAVSIGSDRGFMLIEQQTISRTKVDKNH